MLGLQEVRRYVGLHGALLGELMQLAKAAKDSWQCAVPEKEDT